MLPGVVMDPVGKHVADFVTCNSSSVVAGEQIAPVGIAVGVGDRINGRAQFAGGIAQGTVLCVVKIFSQHYNLSPLIDLVALWKHLFL